MFSIPRMCRLERTMLQSLHGVIRWQRGDFSMDQEERAISEYFSANCHLPKNLGTSLLAMATLKNY
jgi:hypothetical protein